MNSQYSCGQIQTVSANLALQNISLMETIPDYKISLNPYRQEINPVTFTIAKLLISMT